MSADEIQKADQIAFHFYTKLFYALHDARATEGARPQARVDKWFNLETPDCDLFTRDAREPYRSVSISPPPHGPPPLEIEVLLAVPELSSNQVLVYAAPDRPRVRVEPARRFILLETWTLSLDLYRTGAGAGAGAGAGTGRGSSQPESGADVALPTIYKHGIVLFRSLYSLLRVLPAWKFYKRLKRRTGGVNRNGNLGIQLRVRPPRNVDVDDRRDVRANDRDRQQQYRRDGYDSDPDILRFARSPSPHTPALSTQTHTFAPIPHLLGTLTLHTEYLEQPHYFQLDEREALLSSGFLSSDRGYSNPDRQEAAIGFVPTLERHRQRESVSGSNFAGPVARSPPRVGAGATGIGRALSTGANTGTNPSNIGIGANTTTGAAGSGSNAGTTTTTTNLAERFLIPSRVSSTSTGIGPSANTGSSALIPPPRPFPTMTSGGGGMTSGPILSGGTMTGGTMAGGSNTGTAGNAATGNVTSNTSTPASGLALNRRRRESLTSSTSSSASARDPFGYTGHPTGTHNAIGITTNTTSTGTGTGTNIRSTTGTGIGIGIGSGIPSTTTTGTTSLSSSPSSAVPIRRPGINPVHPFKSNTLSSAGGSSPSLSIRQGGSGGSPAGGGIGIGIAGGGIGIGVGSGPGQGVGMPSSLGREVNIGLGLGRDVGGAGGGGGGHSRHTSFSSTHSPVIPSSAAGGRVPPPLSTINPSSAGPGSGPGTGHAWPSPPGHASTFAPSSLGTLAAERPFGGGVGGRGMSVEREGNRRRSVQGVYGAGAGLGAVSAETTGGAGAGTGIGGMDEGRGRPMPMPMQPRRRFESSFGHRYAASAGGSVGSGTSGGVGGSPSLGVGVGRSPSVGTGGAGGGGGGGGGGSAHGSVSAQGSAEGSGRGTPASLREAFGRASSPHTSSSHHGHQPQYQHPHQAQHPHSPQYQHDNSEDKEISIFVQDIDDRKPLSGRTRESESEFEPGPVQLADATDTTVTGKGKGRVYDASSHGGAIVMSPTGASATTTSPFATATATTASEEDPDADPEADAAARLSTSPQRGPILTNELEIDERLRRMNETFLRSLQGIGGSVRKKKSTGSAATAEGSSTSAGGAGAGGSNTSTASDPVTRRRASTSTSTRSGSASTASTTTDATIGPSMRTSPLRQSNPPTILPGTRLATAFPTSPTTPQEREREWSPSRGLGLGLPARVRHASTGSSSGMLGVSESDAGAGASQGSEEVIGRMELDGERRRWGYGR